MSEAGILRADGVTGACVAERIRLGSTWILAEIAALRHVTLTFQYAKQTRAAVLEI
jgi:hypothetical protein